MKRFTKAVTMILAAAMILSLVSCGSGNKQEPTPEPTPTATPLPTPLPTPSPVPTPAPLDEPEAQKIPEGKMIYYEDFESYGNTSTTEDTLAALRKNGLWKIDDMKDMFYANSRPYSEKSTVKYSIEDGKLQIRNYKDTDGSDIAGKDSYIIIEDENYLWEVYKGKYTIQYDLCYQDAANSKRYIGLMWNYWGLYYNSFHFRIGGYANYQVHYGPYEASEWYTIDSNHVQELNASGRDDGSGPSIAMKLLGISVANVEQYFFKNVPVSIRIQVDPEKGATIWMKTSSKVAVTNDWVKISEAVAGTDGYERMSKYLTYCHGGSLCLKTGAKMNGTVDNIMVWTGFGDEPADKTVDFTPTKLPSES